jgi:hypothetical protein
MTLLSRTLQTVLDEANPNKLPAAIQTAKGGAAFRGLLRRIVAQSVSGTVVLPDGEKAVGIVSCFLRSGANAGFKEPVNEGATLAANQCKVTPTGNVIIHTAGSDPEVELAYYSHEQAPITADVAVVPGTGVAALPQGYEAFALLSATATAGTVVGAATVIARGGAPTTGQAALANTGAAVQFLIADAVTRATLVFLPVPGTGSAPASVASKMGDTVAL